MDEERVDRFRLFDCSERVGADGVGVAVVVNGFALTLAGPAAADVDFGGEVFRQVQRVAVVSEVALVLVVEVLTDDADDGGFVERGVVDHNDRAFLVVESGHVDRDRAGGCVEAAHLQGGVPVQVEVVPVDEGVSDIKRGAGADGDRTGVREVSANRQRGVVLH